MPQYKGFLPGLRNPCFSEIILSLGFWLCVIFQCKSAFAVFFQKSAILMADGNGACCLICDLGCPKVSFRIPWLSKLLSQSRVFQSHYRCFLHKKVWIFRAFPIQKRFCLLLILAVCSVLNSYTPQIEN